MKCELRSELLYCGYRDHCLKLIFFIFIRYFVKCKKQQKPRIVCVQPMHNEKESRGIQNKEIKPRFSVKFIPLWISRSSDRDYGTGIQYNSSQSPNLMNLSRVSVNKNPVLIERRLQSWNVKYNFKWNQPYLSRVSNISSGSNCLSSASALIIH